MIDISKIFFNKNRKNDSQKDSHDTPHDIRIATCALLLEMSHIDGEFSDAEKGRIISFLKNEYELSDEHADALIDASSEKLDKSADLWRFASLINQNYSIEEKIAVIEMVWRVAYADGRLNKHEDYLVHKLATLLRLSHKQLIDAKLKAKAIDLPA